MMRRLFAATIVIGVAALAARSGTQIESTPFDDAKPILEAMAEIIPAELHDAPAEHRRETWDAWARKRDAEIRDRLAQGDADSVVNFLLFGTSFTAAPRLTNEQLRSISSQTADDARQPAGTAWQTLFEKRVEDLVRGTMTPGANERLRFARSTLQRAGVDFSSTEAKQKASTYLYENVKRVIHEQASFQQALRAAKSLNDPVEEFAERSKLYKERGLSLDTSLPPDYALEVALKEMKRRGLLKAESVQRVGVIGPGLDFTDKQEGFDFYPTQTVQPFALTDSLLRLQLAKPEAVEVDVLDLSPRILEHVERARRLAATGRGYTIELPKDPAVGWKTELQAYWEHFGDQVGSPAAPAAVPPVLKGITLRAVKIRPALVRRMKTFDVDIVLQRANLREEEKFDLLIATNILVYYGTFEQSLAMTNIAAMLKPGGFLLTNNALLELPSSEMHSAGYQTVVYSGRPDDGDHIVWYQRKK
ncbi:MAG TPA: class I SAM-dependent methyltransferase [Candidatus Dormibacteraeota bacterium]|nr:class I SAM-dependent methyltransferase [Candidatus Dormibacteraeota bacterium]